MDILSVIRGAVGLLLILGIAFLFSSNKKSVNWRLVGMGLLIQLIFAVFIIHSETLRAWFFPLGWLKDIVNWLGAAIVALLGFTLEGSKFVFGKLGASTGTDSLGFFFAFQVLPTIIFVSSLAALLYHLGVLQAVVKGMAWVMAKLLGTSGAETLSNAANVFLGQTEAPLLVRPYIATMTQSEMLTIMIGGMATISAALIATYSLMLGQAYAQFHHIAVDSAQLKFAVSLLAASTMAFPGSMVIAKILYPEIGDPITKGTVRLKIPKKDANVIDAAATGAGDGLWLALNVAAMLLAFIALIALFNSILIWIGNATSLNIMLVKNFGQPLSMQLIFGMILQYIAMGIGVPLHDALNFGSLIGTKTVLNEFVAYLDLSTMIKNGVLSEKAITMATYALCGFANFSSIAIQIGGIGPMAPDRKKDIASFGLKAVLGGCLATLMTATLAGILTQ
ncbi:MAG: nucleoside transporter C-terminal domain-containing protein [Ignavibacteriaceae bacterium]|nr:nucleoside transporter C-terminal domain-containing protein [Ignavibacteriaceae bacterium]